MANPSGINVNPPATPAISLVDKQGNVTGPWYTFFVALWQRTGGATPSSQASALLDTITNAVGSLLFRGATAWQGLGPGAQSKVLRMGVATPEWDTLDGSSFGNESANTVFAGPTSGAPANPAFRALVAADIFGTEAQNSFLAGPTTGGPGSPTFRAIATADLKNTAGQYPGTATNDNAAAGNIGEYIASSIPIGSAVALTSGTTANITSINLTPGDWDVWGAVTTAPAATTTQSNIRAWTSETSATDPSPPNSGAYAQLQTAISTGLSQTLPVGAQRISIAANTTIFLSTNVTFAASTLSAYGFLGARRQR